MRRLNIALLLALAASPCLAEPPQLGRLFFTAEQRARLDLQRQRNPGFQPNADDEASITINGEVRSSNGRRTRWINGEVNWEGNAPSAPVPVAHRSGSRPIMSVATVMVFGRMRFTAPAWIAVIRSPVVRMRPSDFARSNSLSR